MTEDKLVKLIEKSSDLQSLNIIDCPNFTCSGATWAKLSIQCPELKTLRISGLIKMPLLRLNQKVVFPALESLFIENSPELIKYKMNAPKLKKLMIRNCPKLIRVNYWVNLFVFYD